MIDEIEKMCLFSKPFVSGIRAILRQGPQPRPKKLRGMEPLVVLATFPKETREAHQLINEIKSREDCALFEVKNWCKNILLRKFNDFLLCTFVQVNEENRESLVTEISDFLSQSLSIKNI